MTIKTHSNGTAHGTTNDTFTASIPVSASWIARNQKRRRNSVNVTILLTIDLIRAIDALCEASVARSRGEPLNRSAWIRRAIVRDLEHRERGRGKGRVRTRTRKKTIKNRKDG